MTTIVPLVVLALLNLSQKLMSKHLSCADLLLTKRQLLNFNGLICHSTHLPLACRFDNAPQMISHLCFPLLNVVLTTSTVVKSIPFFLPLPLLHSLSLSFLAIIDTCLSIKTILKPNPNLVSDVIVYIPTLESYVFIKEGLSTVSSCSFFDAYGVSKEQVYFIFLDGRSLMHCPNCHCCDAFVVHKKKDASDDHRYVCKNCTCYNGITRSDGCKHILSLAQIAEMQVNFASIYSDCFGSKSDLTTVAYVSIATLQSQQSVKLVYVLREVQTEHSLTCSVETQTDASSTELSKTESPVPSDLGPVPMSLALSASPSPSPSPLSTSGIISKKALTSLLAKPKTRPTSAVKLYMSLKNLCALEFDVHSYVLLNVSFLRKSTCELLLALSAYTSYQEKLVSLAPSSLQFHSGFNPAKPANAEASAALRVHLTNKFVMRVSKIIHRNGTLSIVCKYFLSLLHKNNLSCLPPPPNK
ncbi:hypothetical protein DSO57_1030479 [Entomophthora muscae]|uniref:Uncharacterized protein n=1 Tax=Entomophthora muscae TaxID=34485 RepID=A0ACC2SDT7_9FUNG|nr:hypothetical protein DSO57_1030479 [Entomophthora muscae]